MPTQVSVNVCPPVCHIVVTGVELSGGGVAIVEEHLDQVYGRWVQGISLANVDPKRGLHFLRNCAQPGQYGSISVQDGRAVHADLAEEVWVFQPDLECLATAA